MTQTNEELREKIKELFNDHYWDSLSKDRDLILGHCYFIVDEIMSLIQQPEQITVMVKEHAFYTSPDTKIILYQIVCVGNFNIDFLDKFYSKQEALDWCKRFNLKVVNESDKDGLK